jgi:hypothetical protein
MTVIVEKWVCMDLSEIKHGVLPGKRWDFVRDPFGLAPSVGMAGGGGLVPGQPLEGLMLQGSLCSAKIKTALIGMTMRGGWCSLLQT